MENVTNVGLLIWEIILTKTQSIQINQHLSRHLVTAYSFGDPSLRLRRERIESGQKIEQGLFGMAAMQFPCNGILLIQSNLPRIFPMFTLR